MRPGDSPPRGIHVAGRPGAVSTALIHDRLAMAGVSLTTEELDRVARRYLDATEERRDFGAGIGPEIIPFDGDDVLSADA